MQSTTSNFACKKTNWYSGVILCSSKAQLYRVFNMKLILSVSLGALFLAFSLPAESMNNDNKILRFCYENKEVPPHYMGEGLTVPKSRPGAAIEVIQRLGKTINNVDIEFIRKPWKRCLDELKKGKVDALIGRYSPERATYGIFPKQADGVLDDKLAFSRTMSCFIYDESLPLEWDGRELSVPRPMGAAAPRGYSLVKDLRKLELDIYETATIERAHELLFAGKVKLSVSNCALENKPKYIIEHPIPVSVTAGYLIFSKSFFTAEPNLASYLWRKLGTINKKEIYKKY